jgi:hypothetical protein
VLGRQAGIGRSFPLGIPAGPSVTQMKPYSQPKGCRVSAVMRRRDTERRREFLITLQMNVVDAHFTGLNTIHYLPKEFVFDLQGITN